MNRREFLHVMGVAGAVGAAAALAGVTTKPRKVEAEKGQPVVKEPIDASFEFAGGKAVIDVGEEFAGRVLRVYAYKK